MSTHSAHFEDHPELSRTQRHDRQARLSNEGDILQRWFCFNFAQRDRSTQRFDRNKINRAPITFFRSCIAISSACDFCDADHRLFLAAMIKEHFISLGHATQIVARGKISHSGPTCAAIGHKIGPGIMPFITFEGSEGCGKSTQVQRLAARLEKLGVPFLITRDPGGTAIGESIRELLQFAPQSAGMTPETELLLFEASRSQLVRELIKPALESGKCVIADRFFDSTTVYQGVARKLDRNIVRQLNAFAVGDCVPDVTFLLDVDLKTARSRMQQPRRPDRMEQQSDEFYEKVRDGYQELARWQRDRIVMIEGWQSSRNQKSTIRNQKFKRWLSLGRQRLDFCNARTLRNDWATPI